MENPLSFFQVITKGGFMMIPLLLSAFVALTVGIERAWRLLREYQTPEGVLAEANRLLRAGKEKEAHALCAGKQTPVLAVLASGLEHFDAPVELMELAMKNQGEEWMPILERRVEVLDTIITAAPLMGLLGTITGMMGSFKVMSEKGVNDPNSITGGVAEALIATATGLVIALICLFAYNYLNAKIKGYIYKIEATASNLIEIRLGRKA